MTAAPRRDRLVLAVVGLLLLAGGVLILLRSFGVFGTGVARHRLLTDGQSRFFDQRPWAWALVGAAGALVALLALRWLIAQLRSDRIGAFELEPDPRHGTTVLPAAAVTRALAEEIEGYRGVRSASARLLHDPRHPELLLRVNVEDRSSASAVRTRVEQAALPHAQQAVDLPELPTRILLRHVRAGS